MKPSMIYDLTGTTIANQSVMDEFRKGSQPSASKVICEVMEVAAVARTTRVKTAADPLGPRLAEHKWTAKAAELSQTALITMALRLPALIAAVMRLGRQAAPRDLAVTVVFNVVSGVFTAFGLLAPPRVCCQRCWPLVRHRRAWPAPRRPCCWSGRPLQYAPGAQRSRSGPRAGRHGRREPFEHSNSSTRTKRGNTSRCYR
jgi:hypothetical protein